MVNFLKKHCIFILFVYLTLCAALVSSPVDAIVHFPPLISQGLTVALYLPFLFAIIWKFIGDLKQFRLRPFNILYYLFAAFYVVLTAYRFLTHAEVKEGIYYTVVLLGVFAMLGILQDGKLQLSPAHFRTNFICILIYTVIYKLVFTYTEGNFFINPPVNNLYSTSMLVLMLPFLVHELRSRGALKDIVFVALTALSVALIMICSSRAIVALAMVPLAVFLITQFKPFAAWIKFILCLVCAALVVFFLAYQNVGEVQFSLYRALGITATFSDDTDASDLDFSDTEGNNQTNKKPSNKKPNQNKQPVAQSQAMDQIDRSDTMRSDLLKLGIEEVKKNPVFGTGNLYFTYDLGYKTMEQTPHNFILESLVCYGIVGTLMILAILIFALIDCGFFRKPGKQWRFWVYILLTLFYFFAFGMVQPSVYNTLVCPTFAIMLHYFSLPLLDADKKPVKTLSVLKLGKGRSK